MVEPQAERTSQAARDVGSSDASLAAARRFCQSATSWSRVGTAAFAGTRRYVIAPLFTVLYPNESRIELSERSLSLAAKANTRSRLLRIGTEDREHRPKGRC